VVVAIIDQTGGRSLADHAATVYAPYGKRPDPNLLYGLVYAVAAVGALLWLLVLRVVQSRGRSAPILTVVVTTVTAALALLLLVSSEYGAQIFPPLWGILAIVPAAAGILAAALLRRGSGRAVLRQDVETGQAAPSQGADAATGAASRQETRTSDGQAGCHPGAGTAGRQRAARIRDGGPARLQRPGRPSAGDPDRLLLERRAHRRLYGDHVTEGAGTVGAPERRDNDRRR
jgi:hypothetical protein